MMDFEILDQYLGELYEKMELPGVSVCLAGPEGVVFEKGYGFADGEQKRKVDAQTVYGVASMSKSMTTLCLCMLAVEGKVSFDDPVARYFPRLHIPGVPDETLTLHHLATHTSGIPPMEPLEWSIAMNTSQRDSEWIREMRRTAPNKMETIDQIVDYISLGKYPQLGQPGEYMSYSNEGYALLCYVVDQAAGMPLERFLKERVFEPLGMKRSVLDLDGQEAIRLSGGNITSLFEREEGKLYADDAWSILPPFRGCAQVKSTARDMAVYYRCLANGGRHEGEQVIDPRAVELMIGRGFAARKKPGYCYGLYKREFHGQVICEHGGALHGVSSYGALLKDMGYGLSALCNLSDVETNGFGWAMMNAVMGLPLATSHRWQRPAERPFSAPEMLAGSFLAHEGVPSLAKVYIKDGKLCMEKDKSEYALIYAGNLHFMAVDPAAPDELKISMEFYLRQGGPAWAVKCGSRIYQRVEK